MLPHIRFLHRWNSCKQNKQAANNRAATNTQMVTPEGEKLHSDSGISVDTQSLQEQQHTQAETQPQPSRSHTQEQIGKLSYFAPKYFHEGDSIYRYLDDSQIKVS